MSRLFLPVCFEGVLSPFFLLFFPPILVVAASDSALPDQSNVFLRRSPCRFFSGFLDGGRVRGHGRDGHPQHRGRVGVSGRVLGVGAVLQDGGLEVS